MRLSCLRSSVVLLLAAAAPASGQKLLFELEGSASGAQFGYGLSAVGDINFDGRADFLIGEPFFDGTGDNAGRVLLYSGDGSVLLTITGNAHDWLGYGVTGIADLDQDGRPDFVAGAPTDDGIGSATAYSSADGSVLYALHGVQTGGWYGAYVRAVGDLDLDGYADFGVSAPVEGTVRLYSGQDGTLIRAHTGLFGDAPNGKILQLDAAGDVDLNGVPDVIIGDPFYGEGSRGRATVFSGSDGAILHQWIGDGDYAATFGYAVAGIHDFNGDGHPDLLVGTPNKSYPPHLAGEFHIFSGANGKLLFKQRGGEQSETLGRTTCDAGDVNGDGTRDFLVAAPYYDDAVGQTLLYSGRTNRVIYKFDGDENDQGRFGWVLSPAGDVNADGFEDLLMTATTEDLEAGVVRVFAGNDLFLGADERHLLTGETLELTTAGEPGETAALVLSSVAGLPFFLLIDVGVINMRGERLFSAVLPPAAAGLTIGFTAFATSGARIIDSAEEVIEVQ